MLLVGFEVGLAFFYLSSLMSLFSFSTACVRTFVLTQKYQKVKAVEKMRYRKME